MHDPRANRGSSQRLHTTGTDGYAMVALLVALSIMAVMLSVALPTWRTQAQREKEAELVFRGQQYARAIALFQRKYANAFPPTLDTLVEQKFLRRKYVDPITNGEFQVLYVGQDAQQGAGQPGQGAAPDGQRTGGPAQGQGGTQLATTPSGLSATPLGGVGGIMGVTSKSGATSIREYNGRTRYNEWTFVATQTTVRAGAPNGSQTPTGGVGAPNGPGAGVGRGRSGAGQSPQGGFGPGRSGPGGFNGGGRGERGGGNPSPFGAGPQPFGTGPGRGL